MGPKKRPLRTPGEPPTVSGMDRTALADGVRIAVEDPRGPDSRWCIAQYFAELNARFEYGFDPQRTLALDEDDLTPPSGALFIARLAEKPVGCGGVKFYPEGWAYLKRMWIAKEARGIGLGRRLLGEMERYARDCGIAIVRLETNRALSEAIALYRSAGYHEVLPFNDEPYAHHWFEKTLL